MLLNEPHSDIRHTFHDNADGLLVQKSQEIDSGFLASLRERFDCSLQSPAPTYHQVASVPVGVVDKWLREGFDIYSPAVSASDVVKRLKSEGLDAFVTTKRRV